MSKNESGRRPSTAIDEHFRREQPQLATLEPSAWASLDGAQIHNGRPSITSLSATGRRQCLRWSLVG